MNIDGVSGGRIKQDLISSLFFGALGNLGSRKDSKTV
jgi:hypothetical protein